MVSYANEHGLKIGMRGQGHSRYGRALVEAGIVIDSSGLKNVRVVDAENADAQPGASWREVAQVTLAKGLTPPVMVFTPQPTVGGTLSVGGLGFTSHRHGAQVDNVTELDVVTGVGRLVTCSASVNRELFEMTLAGLGQCGIIVRARLRLVPAPSRALLRLFSYRDVNAYVRDQRRAMEEGRFDYQGGQALRDESGWTFKLVGARFYAPPEAPNPEGMAAGLGFERAEEPAPTTYWDLLTVEPQYSASLSPQPPSPRPALTMLVPASAVEELVPALLTMPADSAGFERFGFYPFNTRRFTRPLLKMPSEEVVFGLWVITRTAPADDPAALTAMLASNRKLLEAMERLGGKRYPGHSPFFSGADARNHYGPDTWSRFEAAKKEFDPKNVLTPGPGIFVDTGAA